jgi:tripartite-type tricarboxylate transporter receptor subunit TctC
MHLHVPLSIAQQDIEAHKQYTDRLTAEALRNYTEAMTQSVAKYKYDTEHMVALHVQETSALLAMALEINASLQTYIAQLQAENAKQIAQLEAQIAADQMRYFRCYMTDGLKTASIPAETADAATVDLWDETDTSHCNVCSAQSINEFMQLPVFDPVLFNTNF